MEDNVVTVRYKGEDYYPIYRSYDISIKPGDLIKFHGLAFLHIQEANDILDSPTLFNEYKKGNYDLYRAGEKPIYAWVAK